ncbi:MAG: DNA ligase [Deltaproteobacteria bacterium]
MSELEHGDSVEVQGSTSTYTLTRQGAVYMCTCPAWRNQGAPVDARTCKHLRKHLGDTFETSRVGSGTPQRSATTVKNKSGGRPTHSVAGGGAKAPPVLLAHKWETDHDPTGWWMSEKLDGIRAYWDGEGFISRLGNKFYAPDWFVADLPADTLDGELWVGRKQFQRTTSIVRSGAQSDEWKQVTYVVFDAPEAKGGFEARIAHIEKVMQRAASPHARALEHVVCAGMDHLREELLRVEALGGEGLMLRQPKSIYAVGRSNTLLKVKTFHDAEATVIGHAPGAGKHEGRLGALIAKLADGTTFNVGTGFSDAEREAPPAIGSIITFRYQELSNDGVPRFPSYVGERVDVAKPSPVAKNTRMEPAAAKIANKSLPKVRSEPEPESVNGDFKVRLVHDLEKKFWEIEVRGGTYYTRFGKLGSPGQTRLTELGSATAAKSDAEKRAAQKRREGYRIDKKP